MTSNKIYVQNGHVIIIDGEIISGFAEGDFILVDVLGEGSRITAGGDGPSLNRCVTEGFRVTISLLGTSPVILKLIQMRSLLSKSPRLFSIQLLLGTSELFSILGCAFGTFPEISSGGKEVAVRKFVFNGLKMQFTDIPIDQPLF